MNRLLKPHSFLLFASVALAFCGCSPTPIPSPGGGEHKITKISIVAETDKDLPVTLRVGERLQLRVVAVWAIPYVETITDKALFTVTESSVGEIDEKALFIARKTGKIGIAAKVRVAITGTEHKVIAISESAAGPNVTDFQTQIELTVVD
jgi:hypothetical protein